MRDLFRSSGPLKVTGRSGDAYDLNISIPLDKDGMMGRRCPNEECVPRYFKLKPGTGITGQPDLQTTCPYCRTSKDPGAFHTPEQIKYAKGLVERQAVDYVNRELERAIGGRRRVIDGGLLSISMELKPARLPNVRRPIEESLRRDLICPECTLHYAVFGLSEWCPDCGNNNFLVHIQQEADLIRKSLQDHERRKEHAGVRVAARDLENAVEDVVSLFEASMKFLYSKEVFRRYPPEERDRLLRTRRNMFQRLGETRDRLRKDLDIELAALAESDEFKLADGFFERRHVIAHNLGVVDQRFAEKLKAYHLLGKDIEVMPEDVLRILNFVVAGVREFNHPLER